MIKLVGHRGLPAQFPENSVMGVKAALESGAAAVEVDVQFSKDGVPVLFHDADLARVTGLSGKLGAFEAELLTRMSAHEPSRLGDSFLGTSIAPLQSLVPIMQTHPEAKLFVEIKDESFAYIDRDSVITALATLLEPIKNQVVIISYDLPVLRKARDATDWPVGWVLTEYCDQSYHWSADFQPEFLIVNVNKIPEVGALWQGLWEWFVYDITDAGAAKRLAHRGIHWIESWDVLRLSDALNNRL